MIVDVTTKIAKSCDTETENDRYALSRVQVTPRDGGAWLSATDGKQLAIVPTTGVSIKQRLIPKGVFPTTKKGGEVALISESGEDETYRALWKCGKKVEEVVGDQGRFPRLGQIIPCPDGNCVVLCLDANLLVRLAQAINRPASGKIHLILPPAEEGVIEGPIAALGDEGFGVVMPWSVEDKGEKIAVFNAQAESYRNDHE